MSTDTGIYRLYDICVSLNDSCTVCKFAFCFQVLLYFYRCYLTKRIEVDALLCSVFVVTHPVGTGFAGRIEVHDSAFPITSFSFGYFVAHVDSTETRNLQLLCVRREVYVGQRFIGYSDMKNIHFFLFVYTFTRIYIFKNTNNNNNELCQLYIVYSTLFSHVGVRSTTATIDLVTLYVPRVYT